MEPINKDKYWVSITSTMICSMMDNRGSMVNRGMCLGTGLGGQSKGNLLTAGLSNDNLLLVYGVGGICKFGNIETLGFNLVFTLDFSDFNRLGHTYFLRSWVGKGTGDLKRHGDKGDLIGLGLIFLPADLMFSTAISIASMSVGWGFNITGSYFHGLRLLVIGDLGGGAGSSDILSLIYIGADLSFHNSGSLLTNGEDTVKAVVIVHNLLDCKSDRRHRLSKGRNTDLSIDGGVGVSARVLGSISWGSSISRGSLSRGIGDKTCKNKY